MINVLTTMAALQTKRVAVAVCRMPVAARVISLCGKSQIYTSCYKSPTNLSFQKQYETSATTLRYRKPPEEKSPGNIRRTFTGETEETDSSDSLRKLQTSVRKRQKQANVAPYLKPIHHRWALACSKREVSKLHEHHPHQKNTIPK